MWWERMCIVQFVHEQFLENGIWVRERTFVQNICLYLRRHTIPYAYVCMCTCDGDDSFPFESVRPFLSPSLFFASSSSSFFLKIIFGLIWIVCDITPWILITATKFLVNSSSKRSDSKKTSAGFIYLFIFLRSCPETMWLNTVFWWHE